MAEKEKEWHDSVPRPKNQRADICIMSGLISASYFRFHFRALYIFYFEYSCSCSEAAFPSIFANVVSNFSVGSRVR